MHLHQGGGEQRDTLCAHISRAPMRAGLFVLASLLIVAGCDSADDAPPVGVRAMVGGEAFRAGFTLGWASPDGAQPLTVSGSVVGADGMRMILLSVPPRVGTFTEADDETYASYSVLADTTMEMWMAGASQPGTDLEIHVTAVDGEHAEGTFAFTARQVDEPTRVVTVTGGTFNVALQEPPTWNDAGGGPRDAILGATRAFDGARLSPAR